MADVTAAQNTGPTFTTTIIDGGLDLVTAPQAVRPGQIVGCLNYEIARVRGLRRMDGYEKFDGGQSPSSTGITYLLVSYHGAFSCDPAVASVVPPGVVASIPNAIIVSNSYYSTALTLTAQSVMTTIPLINGSSGPINVTGSLTPFFVDGFCVVTSVSVGKAFVGKITSITGNTIQCINVLTLSGAPGDPFSTSSISLSDANGLTSGIGFATVYFTDQQFTIPPLTYDSFIGGHISEVGALGTISQLNSVVNTAPTNSANINNLIATYSQIAATVQQVPGQGPVNGLFWLKDELYATRDYIAVTFTGGQTKPKVGDTFYQGASLGAATFRGQLHSLVLSSGNWGDGVTGGNAAGKMMLYNTFGAVLTSASMVNFDSGGSVMVSGTAPSDAAGLFLATGLRGTGLSDQSWQYCDLGWNVDYMNCGVEGADFVDQNVALTETTVASQYIATAWHVGTAGTLPAAWTDSSGSFPNGMSDAGDSLYVFTNLVAGTNVAPQPFKVTGFGFTDADIPPSATIIGIEVQMTCGAIGLANKYSANVVDNQFSLAGISGGARPDFHTVTPIVPAASSTITGAQYAKYTFTVARDIGAPSGTQVVPSSNLGYSALSVSDIKSSSFGVVYAPTLDNVNGVQNLQFGVDQLRVRVTYLAQTNLIYFWNGQTYTDGNMGAASSLLTLPLSHPFDSSMVGWTVIVNGAGAASTVFDGTIVKDQRLVSSPTANFQPFMKGWQIIVYGGGPALSPAPTDGAMTSGTNTLSFAATQVLTSNMVNWLVEVPGASNAFGGILRARIATVNVAARSCTLVTSTGSPANATNTVSGKTISIFQPVIATISQYLSPTQVAISVPFSYSAPPVGLTGNVSTVLAPITVSAPLISKISAFGLADQVTLADTATTTVGVTVSATGTMVINTATLTTTTSVFSPDMVGWFIKVQGAGGPGIDLIAKVSFYIDARNVTLSVTAQAGVVGAAVTAYPFVPVTIGLPVLAQTVMHYNKQGFVSSGSASGSLYFNFISSAGVVGGLPPREIHGNEEIRTLPSLSTALDGGVIDTSIQIATTLNSSAAAMNFMDPSALMAGAPQPDGTLSPPSKYQSVTKNFYASSGLDAIYGVSGGGPAFYFDGVKHDANGALLAGNFSRMLTNLPSQFETPRAIAYHQGHIILGYYPGIIQASNATNTLSFNPLLYDQSARVIGFGDRLTGIASINGDTLCVWTKSTIQMVQGNFNGAQSLYTSTISPTSGGIEYTIQPMANFMYCDFRGITAIGSTNKYGDFELGHYSSKIQDWIIPRVQLSSFFEGANNGIINSVLIRNKNMVRYFFADGAALSMTFLSDNEEPQFTLQRYNESRSIRTWDVVQAFTESLGRDRIFGATNENSGWVYELERGNTFNGFALSGYAILVPDTAQTPYLNKVFTGINIFGKAQDYASFTLSRSADYDPTTQGVGANVINESFGSLSAVPTGQMSPFVSLGTSGLMIEGTAINLRFDFNSIGQFPHILQAVSYSIDEAQDFTE